MIEMQKPVNLGVLGDRVGGDWASPSYQLRILFPWHGRNQINLVPMEGVRDTNGVDAILFQRLTVASPHGRRLFDAAFDSGVPRLLDIDDDFFAVGDDLRHEQSIDVQSNIREFAKILPHFSAVWASTPRLAEVLRDHASPNPRIRRTLPPDWLRVDSLRERHPKPLSILYFGTSTHLDDLSSILPSLKRLALEGVAHTTVIGMSPSDDLPSGIKVLPTPASVLSRYGSFMDWVSRSGNYDIGLAPLLPTRVNASKSSLKSFEYAALGIMPLVSESPSYEWFRSKDLGHLLVPQGGEKWESAVRALSWNDSGEFVSLKRRAVKALREIRSLEHEQQIQDDLEELVLMRKWRE